MTGTEELHGGTAPLAALTTVFAPPCPTTWLITTTKLPSQYPPFPSGGPSSCNPPAWDQNIEGAGFQYYSPAICPGGFVVGPSCDLRKTRTTEGFPSVAPGESVAYCVPAGLTCTTDTTDFRGGVWGFSRDGTKTDATVTVGPAIQIRWVDDDLESLETHPLTPGRVLAEPTTEVSTETVTRIVNTEAVETKSEAVQTDSELQQATPVRITVTRQTPVTPKLPQQMGTVSAIMEDPISTIVSTSSEIPQIATTLVTDSNPPVLIQTPTETTSSPASVGPSNEPSQTTAAAARADSRLLDRGTSIVLIVMLCLLIGIAIWVVSFVLIRRHKAGKLTRWPPSALVRLGIRRGRLYPGREASISSTTNMLPGQETGFTEVESGPPRGTTPNPAELDGRGIGDPPVRWSWMTTVSRFFHSGGRSTRQGSDRSVRPSTPRTGGRVRVFRESFGEKINDPAAILAFPEALQTRSSLWSSSVPSTPRRGSSPWSRLSRDTFGVPKVPRKARNIEQKVLIDGSDLFPLRKDGPHP